MKKVLQFIYFLNDGGAETLIKDYVSLMNKDDFEVSIVTLQNITTTANYSLVKKIANIIPLYKKESFWIKVIRKITGSFFIPLKLKQIIRKEKPDIVHIHLGMLQYFKNLSKDLENVKVFYTCHCEPQIMITEPVYKAAKILLEKNNLQMIALHEDMKNELNAMFGINNTVVLKNGVVFSRFRDVEENKENIRKSLNIKQDAFVIGNIGRFSEQKNHKYLIEIFNSVLTINENSILLLIGDGPKRKEIIDLIEAKGIQNKVVFLKNRTDIPRLLKAMDIFVFPSLYEGFSVTLMEAQVSGIPCVVSKNINQESFFNRNLIDLSIEIDPLEWAKTILKHDIMGPYSRDMSAYDMQFIVNELEKLYLEK